MQLAALICGLCWWGHLLCKAFDKDFFRLGIDSIAVTAQASHSGGSPIIQRECAGFNWQPLSIPASEPVSISPVTVSRIGFDHTKDLRTPLTFSRIPQTTSTITDRKSNRKTKIIPYFFIIKNMITVIHLGAYTGPVDRDFSL